MPGSLVRKLEQLTPLSDIEKQIAMRAPVRMRHVGARQDIVSDGSQPTDISLISEGFAYRYKLLDDGRRQITAFLIPGDICDLRALLLNRMDHAVAALSPCEIAVIPHRRLMEIIEKHPRIGFALWADTMLDAAIYRQWLTIVGRCSAYARIAHLLCELSTRREVVSPTKVNSSTFPMTQTDIGDAMGLSTVHVNRTLQRLRAEGLTSLHSHVLEVLDWARLRAAADFDPSYLVSALKRGTVPNPVAQ
jgi:CRP-like cAMP-binding protein